MREHVFRYGDTKYGLGMVTIPDDMEGAPVVVLFNAGLLHRAEPYRINVLVSRHLAQIGYITIRIDLSGKGDTPARSQTSNRESVALDWAFIKKSLEHEFGKRKLVLFGLCSGADNAIKIAAQDEDVLGLILLDPISRQDESFKLRQIRGVITSLYKLRNIHRMLRHRLMKRHQSTVFASNLRDEPTRDDLNDCCQNLVKRQGRILAFFSDFATKYYNQQGQFGRSMRLEGLEHICEEVYWPRVEHLYSVQVHRDRLMGRIVQWGKGNLPHFKGAAVIADEKPNKPIQVRLLADENTSIAFRGLAVSESPRSAGDSCMASKPALEAKATL